MAEDPSKAVREYQTDHDLLVRLDERYRALHEDIKEMKNGTSNRLDVLEGDHVTREEFEAVRDEVNSLVLWRSYLLGAQAVTLFLLGVAMWYFG